MKLPYCQYWEPHLPHWPLQSGQPAQPTWARNQWRMGRRLVVPSRQALPVRKSAQTERRRAAVPQQQGPCGQVEALQLPLPLADAMQQEPAQHETARNRPSHYCGPYWLHCHECRHGHCQEYP